MTNSKKVLLITITSIIALLSGIFNWLNQFVIVGTIYYFIGFYLNKNLKPKKLKWYNLIFLISPFFLLYTLMVIYKGLHHVMPICVISIIGAFLGLYASHNSKNIFNRKVTYLYVTFLLLFGYIVMPNWIHFSISEENIVQAQFPKDLILKRNDSTLVNLFELHQNKVIVLDLWSSTCVACIKYFPKFEEKSLIHSDSSAVFYTVNMPFPKRDSKIDIEKYVKDYRFTSLYAQNDIWRKLNIKQTPTYIIINKDFNIVYRSSSLKEDKWYYFSTFNSLIKKLKNE